MRWSPSCAAFRREARRNAAHAIALSRMTALRHYRVVLLALAYFIRTRRPAATTV
ncbi:hypothetical protein [Actinoplanes sp. G11-F43]|uniref:hypothetical protein n=1 Tax=Actinoplanes sp. G11-F43 TaxID=3424130 RepID=UPI003D3361E8